MSWNLRKREKSPATVIEQTSASPETLQRLAVTARFLNGMIHDAFDAGMEPFPGFRASYYLDGHEARIGRGLAFGGDYGGKHTVSVYDRDGVTYIQQSVSRRGVNFEGYYNGLKRTETTTWPLEAGVQTEFTVANAPEPDELSDKPAWNNIDSTHSYEPPMSQELAERWIGDLATLIATRQNVQ